MSNLVRLLRIVKRKIPSLFDSFRPFIRQKKYRSFKLYYSRGTSLINCIKSYDVYEPELSQYITSELKSKVKPVFVDVGANIGLITLNVLADIPQTLIYAFEPGPHQYALLKKTIETNNLTNSVILYNEALSNKSGNSSFAIHDTRNASGDGFFFTGRAKSANYISVNCQTLDNWWELNHRPNVNLIKIDTEGSELMVLQGAKKVIMNCQPIITLEIWPDNLRVYPYGVVDILGWFEQQNYNLYTLDRQIVNNYNIGTYFGKVEIFVAYMSQ